MELFQNSHYIISICMNAVALVAVICSACISRCGWMNRIYAIGSWAMPGICHYYLWTKAIPQELIAGLITKYLAASASAIIPTVVTIFLLPHSDVDGSGPYGPTWADTAGDCFLDFIMTLHIVPYLVWLYFLSQAL